VHAASQGLASRCRAPPLATSAIPRICAGVGARFIRCTITGDLNMSVQSQTALDKTMMITMTEVTTGGARQLRASEKRNKRIDNFTYLYQEAASSYETLEHMCSVAMTTSLNHTATLTAECLLKRDIGCPKNFFLPLFVSENPN